MQPGTSYIAFRGSGDKGVVEDLVQGPGYGFTYPDKSLSFDYDINYQAKEGSEYTIEVNRDIVRKDRIANDGNIACG